jgi:chromosomal replication initiation ATPase DnaA
MKNEIFNDYVERIVDVYKIPKEDIFSKIKRMEVVDARQMVYYLCKKRNMSLTLIKKYMMENGYDIGLSTIRHGISSMETRIANDSDYKQLIKNLEK